MAAAAGFNFEDIQIGDILSDVNIGNHGMSSEDVAAMMIGVASSSENQRQQQEEQTIRERERRLVLAVGSTVGIALFVLVIYLINQKLKNRG